DGCGVHEVAERFFWVLRSPRRAVGGRPEERPYSFWIVLRESFFCGNDVAIGGCSRLDRCRTGGEACVAHADRIAERAARGIYLACEQALDRVVTGIDYLDRIEHAVAFEQQFRENSYHSRTRPNFLAFELADVRELLAKFLARGEHHYRTFL